MGCVYDSNLQLYSSYQLFTVLSSVHCCQPILMKSWQPNLHFRAVLVKLQKIKALLHSLSVLFMYHIVTVSLKDVIT